MREFVKFNRFDELAAAAGKLHAQLSTVDDLSAPGDWWDLAEGTSLGGVVGRVRGLGAGRVGAN